MQWKTLNVDVLTLFNISHVIMTNEKSVHNTNSDTSIN